jgi:DNA-binding LytR/AlgR family response regulator
MINISFEKKDGSQDIDIVITASEMTDEVKTLIRRMEDPLAGTLLVSDEEGVTTVLREEDIISISSGGKKLEIRAEDGTYEIRMSMQDVEKKLNPLAFIRISRYEIINLGKVRRFDFSVSGTLRIEMTDGTGTWASRRLITVIKKRLQGGI